jgi:hypothetical protein
VRRKEDHLRDGQILRWALRGVNSILGKIEGISSVLCEVGLRGQQTLVDQLAISTC